jgi:hypothetical protein
MLNILLLIAIAILAAYLIPAPIGWLIAAVILIVLAYGLIMGLPGIKPAPRPQIRRRR